MTNSNPQSSPSDVDGVELVTVYRGGDSATYLLSDFEKYGDDATPLWVEQWRGENAPFKKMELKDSDAVRFFTDKPISQDQVSDVAKWEVKALKSLLKSAQNTNSKERQ